MTAEQEKNPTAAVLGAGCRLAGELTLDNAVLLGRFEGVLRVAGLLEIGESACVSGTIVAGRVRIAGAVEANIVADESVELLAGSSLTGDIRTREIRIAAGAAFRGGMTINENAAPPEASPQVAPQATQRRHSATLQPSPFTLHTSPPAADDTWTRDAEPQRLTHPAVMLNRDAVRNTLRRRHLKVLRPAA